MSEKLDPWLYRILTCKILRGGILLLAGLFFFPPDVSGQARVGQEARRLIDAYHALWQAQPGEAAFVLEGLLADHPEDPALLMAMAEALLALGQEDQAQSYADRAAALRLSDADLGLAAYRIAAARDDIAGAQSRLETLFERFPTHPEVAMLFAAQVARDGRLELARTLWSHVRSSSALWGPQAAQRLHETQPRPAQPVDAAPDFSIARARHLLNQHPDQPEAYLRLAFAAWNESPTSREAETTLEDLTLIFGDHPAARLGEGWRLIFAQNLEGARTVLEAQPTVDVYAEAFAFARSVLNRLSGTFTASVDLQLGSALAVQGLAPPPQASIWLHVQAP